MRKITQRIGAAFEARKSLTVGNTATDGNTVWLFGNKIIERRPDGHIWVTMAGWNTPTTKERCNGIANAGFHTIKGGAFKDNVPINPSQWYISENASPSMRLAVHILHKRPYGTDSHLAELRVGSSVIWASDHHDTEEAAQKEGESMLQDLVKPDRRFSVAAVFCGHAVAQYNLTWCGDKSLGFFTTRQEAEIELLRQKTKHIESLTKQPA